MTLTTGRRRLRDKRKTGCPISLSIDHYCGSIIMTHKQLCHYRVSDGSTMPTIFSNRSLRVFRYAGQCQYSDYKQYLRTYCFLHLFTLWIS
jgi:hypothetical protein